MKLSFFTSAATPTSSATTGVVFSTSALSISNRQENVDAGRESIGPSCDRAAVSASATATPSNASPSLPKLERIPDYFRDTMDWLIGRSRRKGGAGTTAATTTGTGQGGGRATGPFADKENLEFRATAPKKRQPARDGAGGGSSCSSGSSGGGGPESTTRRYNRQPRKVGPGEVRESRSADLASISSASGAAALAVCDTVSEADFEQLVRLPPGMDPQEWMASHMLALFHHVNALYGAVCEFCTKESCPVMCGPGNVQFLWLDDKNKKVKYPAPQYVDCVMSFAERTVRSEDTFPTKFGNEFPANFDHMLKKLCRLLYHVLAHLHATHWEHLRVLGIGSQAAAVHWHLFTFARHFQMLESKDAAGLVELTSNLRRLNIIDDSIAETAPTEGERHDDGQEAMDAGVSEPPPRLQEANAQLQ